MTKQVKVRAFVCIDEHGDYRIVGSSMVNDDNKHQAIAIIQDELKKEGVNTFTTSFQVMVDLPSQSVVSEEKSNAE